jgi:mercuric ion transport protein
MSATGSQTKRTKLRQLPLSIIGVSAIIALLSASCCVLPIGLAVLGIGGTWLPFLAPFVVFRELILTIVTGIVGWMWISRLRLPSRSKKHGVSLILAIVITTSLLLAWSAPLWEQQVSRVLWNIWVNR